MRRRLLRVFAAVVVLAAVGHVVALFLQRAWERAESARWTMTGELYSVEGGRTLRAFCAGSGTPTVLFEASGLGGADQNAPIVERLRGRTRACAYDRAGFGYSEERASPPTLEDLAADLWAVAKRSPGPYVLVGASYGGLVVQYAARTHGPDVAGLVLLDAVGPSAFKDLEEPWRRLDRSTTLAEHLSMTGLLRWADPLHVGGSQAAWLSYRPSTWRTVHALLQTRHGAVEAMGKLPPLRPDLPLRVVRHTRVGDLIGPDFSLQEHQALEPRWQQVQAELAAQSSRGKLVAAEGVGHVIAAEAPALVEQMVIEVIDGGG